MNRKTASIIAVTSLLLLSGCGTAQVSNTSNSNSGTDTPAASNTSTTSSANTTSATDTTSASIEEPTPLMNKEAPSFTMEVYGSGGKTTSLKQILASGQPVILNVFASWCPPCNEEAPDLKKLQEQYKGKVKVIGVDMTNTDTLSGLKAFVNKYSLPYTIVLDKKSVFQSAYNIAYYPTSLGLSTSGQVKAYHVGYMTKTEMEAMAKRLLATS